VKLVDRAVCVDGQAAVHERWSFPGMKIVPTPLEGAYLVEPERFGDDRGHFARLFCARTFEEHGLSARFVQANESLNRKAGTLRGMHYQLPPHAETKLVRCVRGALHDIILDLRPESPTFGQSFGADLTPENGRAMYVPRGFAHGFATLVDDTVAVYFVDEYYNPEHERGVRWNDPKFQLQWPIKQPTVISDKDANQRDWDPEWHLSGRAPRG